jgi:hypothetical protein
MVAIDVLPAQAEQRFLVSGLEVMTAGTFDCKHGVTPLPISLADERRRPGAMLLEDSSYRCLSHPA